MAQARPPTARHDAGMPTVLIVDDDPDIALLLRFALEEVGYSTLRAANGEEALDVIRSRHPDVVLLDVMMPRMDGWTALEELKALPWRPRVIVVSARSMLQDRARALELGADAFVAKPFAPEDIVDSIERAFGYPYRDATPTDRVSTPSTRPVDEG